MEFRQRLHRRLDVLGREANLGREVRQVGAVAASRRGSRSHRDRLALALDLLRDSAFDALLSGRSRFDELPDVMTRIAEGRLPALCHTITYDEG